MANRVYNFAAGPAAMPLPVLEQAARELTDCGGTGMSVMEMSHRSPAFEEIIASAYDPIYGARPLRRYLQHTVETLISKKIIADQVEPGSRITVDCRDGQLTVDSREVLTGEVIDA